MNVISARWISGLMLVSAAVPVWACSSCGCTLGTEWADAGFSAAPGLRVDLRYDLINQSRLRHGTHGASADDVAAALADGSAEETQVSTFTRFYTLGLDWANRDWGVNLQLPYLQRSHGTLADGDTDVSSSDASGMGDMRITARYQGFFADRSFGVMAGVKLATGDFHQTFESGPQAGGALDRGLQRGTGTTDGIIGVYHYTALSRDWDLFEQAQFKGALGAREDFRPGNQWIANVGLRYVGAGAWIPQAQLNYKHEAQESGAQADQPNSGSDELYLSPGLAWRASRPLALYGFVQLPLYRRYTGLQLAPEYSVTTGVRYSF